MALETGTYISDLVSTNPAGSDDLAFADDHLRLIKSTLQNTFPNITGPVTLNQDNLNTAMPIGGIIMWYGGVIPAGWAMCNGQTVVRSDGAGNITTPNLRDLFIVGAGGSYALGAQGGNAFITLSQAQMPSHTHSASTDTQGSHSHGGGTSAAGSHSHTVPSSPGLGQGAAGGNSVQQQSGSMNTSTVGDHTHPISLDGAHTHNVTVGATGSGASIDVRSPYCALYYIMKV